MAKPSNTALLNEHTLAHVSLFEAAKIYTKIGVLSFGGPAGQIALMHRLIVDENKWLEEKQFLHALNFCMLLPGPEAMQLATYCGWLLHGVKGGLIAGLLFIVPGLLVLLGLSTLYVTLGHVPIVEGLLFGLKAAVLVIVVQALVKVAKRALKGWHSYVLAIVAFISLSLLRLPFPFVIFAAGMIGFLYPPFFTSSTVETESVKIIKPLNHIAKTISWAVVFWGVPLVMLYYWLGPNSVFVQEAAFFSKASLVTFGGAYAVLAYVGQQAVEVFGWLKPDEMLMGLGLAETTPGPLVLVLVFVGYVGAFRDAIASIGGIDPLFAGLLGALITAWVTFAPCFIWIFLGAPFIEALRGNIKLSGALAAITAAVVGVIANLSFWFAIHVLFKEAFVFSIGPIKAELPILASLDWQAGLIAIVCAILTMRGMGLFWVLGAATLAGASIAII